MTLRQVLLLENEIGHKLRWVEVTVHGDAERMVLVTTPRCAYCGTLNPTGHCERCGASVLVAGT